MILCPQILREGRNTTFLEQPEELGGYIVPPEYTQAILDHFQHNPGIPMVGQPIKISRHLMDDIAVDVSPTWLFEDSFSDFVAEVQLDG